MRVVVKNVRIRFAEIFEPKLQPGAKEPKFSLKAVIEPGTENVEVLKAAMSAVAKEKWNAKAENIEAAFIRTGRKPDVCFVEEPYRSKDGDIWEGFDGMFYLSASCPKNKPPRVVDHNPNVLLTQADGRPYDGSYVNVSMDIWAQDNEFGRGIRADLKGVQYVSKGDAFGGSPVSDGSEFGVIALPEDDFV